MPRYIDYNESINVLICDKCADYVTFRCEDDSAPESRKGLSEWKDFEICSGDIKGEPRLEAEGCGVCKQGPAVVQDTKAYAVRWSLFGNY